MPHHRARFTARGRWEVVRRVVEDGDAPAAGVGPYLVASLVLGAGFLGFGVAFAALRTRERASRLFLASIAYLPLLLGALALL